MIMPSLNSLKTIGLVSFGYGVDCTKSYLLLLLTLFEYCSLLTTQYAYYQSDEWTYRYGQS